VKTLIVLFIHPASSIIHLQSPNPRPNHDPTEATLHPISSPAIIGTTSP
jgi:hypothetical protein